MIGLESTLGRTARRSEERRSEYEIQINRETKQIGNTILHRIECVESFADIRTRDKGGWIENEDNLSQDGNAWVYGNAQVYGDAKVHGNAWVYGNAQVYGNAWVYGDAQVYGNAWVYGDAQVCGDANVYGDAKVYGNAWLCGNAKVCSIAKVCGNAKVYGDACVMGDAKVSETNEYMTIKNSWTSNRILTYTKSNKKWSVGCFYGTGEELVAKAYKDSELSGRCYEATVEYVEKIYSIIENY